LLSHLYSTCQHSSKELGECDAWLTPCWHVLCTQYYLDSDEGYLHASTGTDTGQNLVTDPSSSAGIDFQCLEQASSDGEDGGTEPHERSVPSESCNETPNNDGCEGDADKVWYRSYTGTFCRRTFDSLEVEWKIEYVPTITTSVLSIVKTYRRWMG